MSLKQPDFDKNQAIFDPKKMSNLLLSNMLKKLNDKEQELRTLTNNTPDAIVRFDIQGHLTYVNSRAKALFGSNQSLIGKTVTDVTPVIDKDIFETNFQNVIHSRAGTSFETLYINTSGENGWVHLRMVPEFDDEGQIISVLSIGRDITERKELELALQENQERLQTIIENEPECIKIIDSDGRLVYMNPAGLDMIEATLEQVQGKEVLGVIVEKYRDAFIQMHQRVIAGEKVHLIFETIGLRGKHCWLETTSVPMQSNGETVLLGVTRDITERKHSEETLAMREREFRSLAENTPDNIARWDTEGRYLYINPVHERTLGKTAAEVIGTFIPDSHEAVKAAIAQVVATGEQITVSQTLPAKDGSMEYHEVRIVPERDTSGPILSVMAIGRDITKQKRIEIALEKSEHSLKEAQRIAHVGSWDVDILNDVLTWSDETYRMWEIDKELFEATFEAFLETVHPEDRELVAETYNDSIINHAHYEVEHRLLFPDGRVKYIHERGEPHYDEDGKPIRFIGTCLDITERKKMEKTIFQNENRLKEAQKIAKLGSWEVEFPELRVHWSDEAYRIFEINPNSFEPSYDHFLNVVHPDDRIIIDTLYHESLQNKTPYDVTHRLLMSDGRIKYVHERGESIYDEEGNPIRSIGTVQDVTEQKSIEKKIEHMAHHDALTGLPNRTLAKARAEQLIVSAKRSSTKAAILFIDLDGFKLINDTLGHFVGDSMLQTVASRLQECVRESDIISRQGGDEFLVILSNIKENNVIDKTAKKILKELEKPFESSGNTLSLSGSVGIALYPDHGETFDALLQSADLAMYKAKETGKNTYCFYTQQLNHNLIGQFKIQNDLKTALTKNEFVLFYQPQIDLSNNTIIGVEALIRWKHPQLGMIPPMNFIPIAENSGLIVPIGQWVIEEACRQAALWQKMGIELTVAVNISAMQFKRGNLEEVVQNAITTSKIDPKWIELELTESVLMHDTEITLHCVRTLKDLGVQLSIDDFGTGYSSLAYLKRFAVDKLKIDQSFVQNILENQEDAVIVQTIIQMAKNLNLKTIAEGVEDAQVLAVIDGYGCDEVQGYHFAKPMEAAAFEVYYDNYKNE